MLITAVSFVFVFI